MSVFKKYLVVQEVQEIEAVQFTDENKDQVFNELTGQHCADTINDEPVVYVKNYYGDNRVAYLGDWIIKGSNKGVYEVVTDDDFQCQRFL